MVKSAGSSPLKRFFIHLDTTSGSRDIVVQTKRRFFWSFALKLEKLWTAITRKIMTSGQRMDDHQKRGTFPFKTLSHLSRYDFRFPRYRRAKTKVIFNRSSISILVAYSDLSLAPRLTDLPQSTNAIPGRTVVSRKKYRSRTHSQSILNATKISNPYISATNRDESKSNFNGIVFLSILWLNLDDKILFSRKNKSFCSRWTILQIRFTFISIYLKLNFT